MLIREGDVSEADVNPYLKKDFYVELDAVNKISEYSLIKRYGSGIKFCIVFFTPLILINFYVSIFSFLNTHEIYLITKIILFFSAMSFMFGVITINPRNFITRFTVEKITSQKMEGIIEEVKGVKSIENYKKIQLIKRIYLKSIFSLFRAYVENLPTDRVYKTFGVNVRKLASFFENSLILTIAIFFLLHKDLTFSFGLLKEFSLMVIFGIPDMLFSGIVTASGISYALSFNLTTLDKVLLGIANVSLFSSVLCFIYNEINGIKNNSFQIRCNYAKLDTELSFSKRFPLGSVIILEYGDTKMPYGRPCMWHTDKITDLAFKQVDWAFKNIDKLKEFDNRESWRTVHSSITYRGFRRSSNPKRCEVEYYQYVSFIYIFKGSPVVCFFDSVNFSNITKLIIHINKNIIELEDSAGAIKPIPFEYIFPFSSKTINSNKCTFINENHTADLEKSGLLDIRA